MTPEQIQDLQRQHRLDTFPRSARPRCGAKTKAGTPCMAQGLKNGRCAYHGGLSTGPNTPEGLAKCRERGKAQMQRLWAGWRDGQRPHNLSEGGRKRISEAQKRRHEAKRQATSSTSKGGPLNAVLAAR
jgi:hypothetical protein